MHDPQMKELISFLVNSFEEQYNKAKTDAEKQAILDSIKNFDTESLVNNMIEDGCNDTIERVITSRFENCLLYRAEDAKFLASLDSKWNRGFIASEMLYYEGISCIEEFKRNIDDLPPEEKEKIDNCFTVMVYVFSRACQQYLEIITLVKNGLADGALSRWRSLYELCIVSSFILKYGERVAKAFIDAGYSYDKYNWAKASGVFPEKKSIRFSDIEKHCDIDTSKWDDEYKQATVVLHPSAQGTFQRIGSKDMSKIIPAGKSDFGVAYPAIIASKTFIQIIVMFLNLYPTTTHLAMAKVFLGLISFVEEEYKWCMEHIDWNFENPIVNGENQIQ